MTIEEYKEIILSQIKKADDCEEVELIINRSIERMREKQLNGHLIVRYLHKLNDRLEALSIHDFDAVHWCNIRCAAGYLKRLLVIEENK